jgi:hypothetical protein
VSIIGTLRWPLGAYVAGLPAGEACLVGGRPRADEGIALGGGHDEDRRS